jgi:acetyltransferase-like isoleucine patch superfamily enzyme
MTRLFRLLLLDLLLVVRGALWRLLLRLQGGRMGPGARLYGGARIVMGASGARIEIAPNFRMLRFAIINTLPPAGRVVIGKWVHLGEGSMVTASERVEIGDDVVIGPQTLIVDTDHGYHDPAQPIRIQGLVSRPILIEQGVWIAGHVTILKGVRIGRGAIVGAGAVVSRDIPPLAIAVGVPARVIRYRLGAPRGGDA